MAAGTEDTTLREGFGGVILNHPKKFYLKFSLNYLLFPTHLPYKDKGGRKYQRVSFHVIIPALLSGFLCALSRAHVFLRKGVRSCGAAGFELSWGLRERLQQPTKGNGICPKSSHVIKIQSRHKPAPQDDFSTSKLSLMVWRRTSLQAVQPARHYRQPPQLGSWLLLDGLSKKDMDSCYAAGHRAGWVLPVSAKPDRICDDQLGPAS